MNRLFLGIIFYLMPCIIFLNLKDKKNKMIAATPENATKIIK